MLFERIGYGGMANIYLARRRTEPGAGKLFVIKEILPDLATNGRAVEMLVEEARISMCFEHPNVVHVYDVRVVDGQVFLAMEYVPGQTLRAWQRTNPPLGERLEIGRAHV